MKKKVTPEEERIGTRSQVRRSDSRLQQQSHCSVVGMLRAGVIDLWPKLEYFYEMKRAL